LFKLATLNSNNFDSLAGYQNSLSCHIMSACQQLGWMQDEGRIDF
jgi:hypothetical protein